MTAIVWAAVDQPTPATVSVGMAVAGFTAIALMWMARTYGRGGAGIARLEDQDDPDLVDTDVW